MTARRFPIGGPREPVTNGLIRRVALEALQLMGEPLNER